MQKFFHIVGLICTIQVTINSYAFAGELGSMCDNDHDCNVENSRCYQNQCSCLPFYAVYNSTICLQSNMLGFECLVPEQCSKKVANSNCIGGICRCEPGFLQFRRHTCLTAARIGDVCYSDMHCRLWDGDSHCHFMIANLFGRCVCNAPLKQSRSGSCQPSLPSSTTSTLQSFNLPHPVITKTEMQVTGNKTTINSQKLSTPSTSFNNKFQNQATKSPPRVKPDIKFGNKTDNPVKLGKPKPDKPLSKPDKPTKKPEHKLPFTQFLNKTQQQLEHLSNKLASFYQTAANIKPSKLVITAKPSKITSDKVKTTSVTRPLSTSSPKPISSTSAANVQLPTKINKPPSKTETIVKAPDQKHQADKILVVNNSNKKPSKNKFAGMNKTNIKNPFLASFPFLSGNASLETSILRYPINLNKQMETMAMDHDKHDAEATANISSILIGPLHHRVAEDLTTTVSLGYSCKTDAQCMKNDNNSRCINGFCDCMPKRTRLENACSARNRGCHKGTFQCKSSGVCISWFFVCDGRKDCSDGSDEDCKDKNACPEQTFRCGSTVPAVCISQASRCDDNIDCPNGEDEHNCTATKYKNCPAHTFQCEDGRCLPEYEFCNAVISCADGSDEPNNSCTATWSTSVRSLQYCPFRCTNGRCRSSAVVCSGRDGCGDNSDENKCSVCKCPPAA